MTMATYQQPLWISDIALVVADDCRSDADLEPKAVQV
jgi:hypothetical protein